MEESQPPARAYVVFHAGIDGNTSQQLISTCTQLVNNGYEELYILISTPGGNVMSGMTIYNVLRGLPCKIIMHNVGNIDSIGNAIFLAGEERYASKHSTFMFHGVGIPVNAVLEEKGVRETLDAVLSNQKRIGDIVRERTRINEDEVRELFREARTKDADPALSAGIIMEIAEVSVPKGAPIVSLVLDG